MSGDSESDERHKLAEKLDSDLEQFISGLKKRTVNKDVTLEELEKDLKDHPLFMNQIPEDGQLPPLVEALQSLKYDPDENSPEELARSYKDDGNYHFKLKNYHRAITSYTEGLKLNCGIDELNVQLLTNRAAAHYHLGNFRKSLQDCETALKIKPTHMKALIRSSQCNYHLELFDSVLKFCEEGLKLDPNNKELAQLMLKAEHGKKLNERNRRKAASHEKKKHSENEALLKAIKERGICLQEINKVDEARYFEVDLSFLEPCHPAATSKVKLDVDGALIWPVIFLYPEYGQTDFIQTFNENDKILYHLELMFNPEASLPPWDDYGQYKLENLKLYFEDTTNCKLIPIDPQMTLLNVLKDKRFEITGGVPAIIVLVQDSCFQKNFLKNFN